MMYGCLPSDEQDLNEQEELESVEVKPKKGKKLAVKVGAFVLAGSIVGSIVAWDYFNSNVNVDVPLEDIVAEQSEESVLDEKLAENDSFSFDKINELEHYVLISNRLAEMDLNSVCEGMKALTDEEKQEVEAYTILDIEKMLNDIDELNVYKEINKSFGIYVVRMRIKPEQMYLKEYSVDEKQRYAVLFYDNNGEVIKYSIYLNDSDSSFGQKETDALTDEYKIEKDNVIINVKEYSIEANDKKRYIVEFEYRDVNYQLKGIMKKTELQEIINNLIFL